MAYREPSKKLPRTVSYSREETDFLNSICPWVQVHWSKSFGSADQNSKRNDIKVKIKTQLEGIQDNYCAFCGLNLKLAYKVEREHIAPQYKHPHYIFEPENLVLACNFCNQHKGKKLTVINDTHIYSTTTFKILHPHRDNYSDYLACDIKNFDLIFTIVGPNPEKTQNTIDCVGLADPHLMCQRGAIILKAALPVSRVADQLVKEIIEKNRIRK